MIELVKIQWELDVPKWQYNNFWKYKFRSTEDILWAIKPLLTKYECSLTVTDQILLIGDRYYVESTATLKKGDISISTKWLAREANEQKWMNDSQLTGSTSSYARKYALSGLFAIDDEKDSDSTNTHDKVEKKIDTSTWEKKTWKVPEWQKELKEYIDEIKQESDTNHISALFIEASKIYTSEKQIAWLKKEARERTDYLNNGWNIISEPEWDPQWWRG